MIEKLLVILLLPLAALSCAPTAKRIYGEEFRKDVSENVLFVGVANVSGHLHQLGTSCGYDFCRRSVLYLSPQKERTVELQKLDIQLSGTEIVCARNSHGEVPPLTFSLEENERTEYIDEILASMDYWVDVLSGDGSSKPNDALKGLCLTSIQLKSRTFAPSCLT